MAYDPIQSAREIVSRTALTERSSGYDPIEAARRIAAGEPEEEEEGLDIFQPIRTFFGASQAPGGYAVGAFAPEAYEAAKEEMRQAFGVEEGGPWYETVEALPGAGDVAAQLVPEDVRESLVGRALGPVARMGLNIAGDPTTYLGAIAAKGALSAVRGIEGGADLLKTTQIAKAGRRARLAAKAITRGDAAAGDFDDARRIAQLVLDKGTPAQQRAFRLGIGLAKGGPLAMGAGAAVAYGPEAAGAAWEGAKRTFNAESPGEAAAEGVNATLMAGLTALMGKGLIDAATATAAWNRHLKDTRQIPDSIDRTEQGLAAEAETAGEIVIPEEVPPINLPSAPEGIIPEPKPGGPIDWPVDIPEIPTATEGILPTPRDAPPLNLPVDDILLDAGFRAEDIADLTPEEKRSMIEQLMRVPEGEDVVVPGEVPDVRLPEEGEQLVLPHDELPAPVEEVPPLRLPPDLGPEGGPVIPPEGPPLNPPPTEGPAFKLPGDEFALLRGKPVRVGDVLNFPSGKVVVEAIADGVPIVRSVRGTVPVAEAPRGVPVEAESPPLRGGETRPPEAPVASSEVSATPTDPLLAKAKAFIEKKGEASTSLLQRRFKIGRSRAQAILDQLGMKEGAVGDLGDVLSTSTAPRLGKVADVVGPDVGVDTLGILSKDKRPRLVGGERPEGASVPQRPAQMLDYVPAGSQEEFLRQRGWTVEEFNQLPAQEQARVIFETEPGERFPGEPVEKAAPPAKWYHKDHGLKDEHVQKAEAAIRDLPEGVHVVTLRVDEPLESALYGPKAGDAPVAEGEVVRVKRGDRPEPSRMVRRGTRPSNEMTVVGNKNADGSVEIYTAYGGPEAPREPWDTSLTPEERAESEAFWREHALATGEEPAPVAAEPEPVLPDVAQFEEWTGGRENLDAALAQRGVNRAQFEGLNPEDRVALFSGAKTPEQLGLTKAVAAEAPSAPSASGEPAAQSPLGASGSPLENLPPPNTPEAPAALAGEASRTPPEAPVGVLADPDVSSLLESEGRRAANRPESATAKDLDGMTGVLADDEWRGKLEAQLREITGEPGTNERRRGIMGVFRKLAKEFNQLKEKEDNRVLGHPEYVSEKARDAALRDATESAEGKKKTQRTLKQKAKDRGPNERYATLKEHVTGELGMDFDQWMRGSQTWKSRTGRDRGLFERYLKYRDFGENRVDAIQHVIRDTTALKLAERTISTTIIGKIENDLVNEASGVTRTPRSAEEIALLQKLKNAAKLPARSPEQTPMLFAERLRQNPQEGSMALANYLRFAYERDKNRAGLPSDLRSIDDLRQFARDVGLDPNPKEEVEALVAGIAKQIGLDPTLFPKYLRQVAAEEARGGRVSTQFRLEGFEPVQARVDPTSGTLRGVDEWKHPSGLRVRTSAWGDDNYIVEIAQHGDNPDAIAAAIKPLLENPRITFIDASDAKVVKGVSPVDEAMDRLGLSQVEVDAIMDRRGLKGKARDEFAENYERILYGVNDNIDSMATRMEDIVENYLPHAVDDVDSGNWISDAMAKQDFAIALRNKLKAVGVEDLDMNNPIAPLKNQYGEDVHGTYHRLYRVSGTTPDGNGLIVRVGRAPTFAYPTDAQRALVMPVLAKGKLFEDSSGTMYYTVHPEMRTVAPTVETITRLDRTALLSTANPVLRHLEADDLKKGLDQIAIRRAELEQLMSLPDGLTMQENFDAHAELLTKAEQSGLQIQDLMSDSDFHGRGKFRFDQFGWIPVEKATPEMVVRRDMHGKLWRLVFSDYGTVFPDAASRAGSVWEYLARHPAQNHTRLSLKELEPNANLSLADQLRRQHDYTVDLGQGLDIGEGLKAVNNDRLMSDTYVQRAAELGKGAALGLRRVVRDLRDKINARDDTPFAGQLDVDYAGLTMSPHISGQHLRVDRRGQILSNMVEAVNAGSSYEDAIEKALYTIIHEVTHNKAVGHEVPFLTIHDYVKRIATAEKQWDQYKKWVKQEFTEADYRAMRDELVPEFRVARNTYGGRESWRRASVERFPVGTPASRAAASAYRRLGSEEAPARGVLDGIQPSRAIQRGSEGPTGSLRAATSAERTAAARHPEGEAARSFPRGGTAAAAVQHRGLVSEVQDLIGRGTNYAEDIEKSKRLIDELVESGTLRGRPVREIYQTGWDMAGALLDQMTPDEIAERAKSLPSPRHPDQFKGAINMLHFPDLSDRTKAQWQLMYEFTKGHWSKDKVRHWNQVEDEVKQILDINTPEAWIMAFKHKGGGLTDRDSFLLRTAFNELAGRLTDYESRYAEALQKAANGLATPDDVRIAKEAMDDAERKMLHAGLVLEPRSAATARALAIHRATIRRMDPKSAWRQDLIAGLRERLRSKIKDPVEVNKKALELFEKLEAAQAAGGDWGEFYRAYRTIMRSSYTDKALEWYKAGLLGWPSRVANLTSNGLFRAVRYVEDGVAGALDFTVSGLTGKERDIYAGEVAVSTLAARRAFLEAFPKWRQENINAVMLRPEDFLTSIQRGSIMEDLLHSAGAIEGKKGEFVRFQLKGLGADDRFAKHMSRMDTYYRMIYRNLRKGNVEGFVTRPGESLVQATERYAMDLRDNWNNALSGTPHSTEKLKLFEPIAKEAERIASEDTFQEELGNFGRGFQSALRELPIMQVFFPFVRTPTNIAKQTIKRTPLGLIKIVRDWEKMTPAQRMTEMSKPITGTAIGLGVMALALSGDITGGGPLDYNDRETKKRSGWEPYSVRLWDWWLSFQRFEPIASIMGMAADAAEGLRDGDFDTWEEGSLRVLTSAAENVTNKTFTSGMDSLAGAFSRPKEALGSAVRQTLGSLIPNSIGFIPVGHLARAVDATYRQVEPMSLDAFYAKIPWLSEQLPAQYTPTGEERKRPGTALERAFSPFARVAVVDGPEAWAADEIVRVDASPQPPRKYWYGRGGVKVNFTREEQTEFAKALQAATNVIGQRVIKDPNYLRLPDNDADPRYRYGMKTKRDVLRNIFQRYRSEAMRRVRKGVEKRAHDKVARRA